MKIKAYLISAGLAILGILLALLKAFSAGKSSQKAETLETFISSHKRLREAERAIDTKTKDKIDEISTTKQSRGRFTK